MFTENVNVIYSYMCNYSFIHTHIIVSIVIINTSIIVYLKPQGNLNS